MTFAATIKAKRQALGLTQLEFATMLTVSQQTVNNWETGRVEPWPRKRDIFLRQLGSEVMPVVQSTETDSRRVDTKPLRATGAYQRRTYPTVSSCIQEIVAQPQIVVRRPPPHG